MLPAGSPVLRSFSLSRANRGCGARLSVSFSVSVVGDFASEVLCWNLRLFRGLAQICVLFRICLYLPRPPHENWLEQHCKGHRA